ncbi:MAG: helix-turn-helix domain-containing protein [Myxococcota bacterium]
MTTGSNESLRRTQILRAAERLLVHYGLQKTTIGDIAREARIGVGTVYLEFESKDAIVLEISRVRHADVLKAMREIAVGPGSYEERLREMLDRRCQMFLAIKEVGQHAHELVHCVCPAVKDAHQRFQQEEHQMLRELLQAANRQGEFSIKDPELTATALQRAYAAFTPPWLYSQPRDEVEPLLKAMHQLVLQGLLKRRNGR